MSLIKTTSTVAVLIGLTVILAACSEDKHLFYSSVELPTNVTVYDPLAAKPVWFQEIPVGKTLELDFDRGKEKEADQVLLQSATSLTWKLYEDIKAKPIASDRIRLPGTPVIIKVSYRPGPEYPAN